MSSAAYMPLRNEESLELDDHALNVILADDEEEELFYNDARRNGKYSKNRYAAVFNGSGRSSFTNGTSQQGDYKDAESIEMSETGESYQRRPSLWQQATQHGNKRTLFTAFGVGIVLMILVISASVLVTNHDDSEPSNEELNGAQDLKLISAKQIVDGTYSFVTDNSSWISDDEISYRSLDGDIVVYSVSKRSTEVLVPSMLMLKQFGELARKYTISPDRKFILLAYGIQEIYRHSYVAKYSIFDVAKRTFEDLVSPEMNFNDRLARILDNSKNLQLATFTKTGNGIMFVSGNNLFYRSSPEPNTPVLQITTSGSDDIFNGITDWVYEEDMFENNKAFWTSPDSLYVAYVTFDDKKVEEIAYFVFGNIKNPRFQYPMTEAFHYPKAGTPNPTVKLSISKLDQSSRDIAQSREMNLRVGNIPKEYLIGRVFWSKKDVLNVLVLNRVQNQSWILSCSTDAECSPILEETSSTGWIDVSNPIVSKDGESFLILHSQKQDDELHYHHILLFSTDSTKRFITTGRFSVEEIVGWDEVNKLIYFVAPLYDPVTKHLDPSQRHLYKIQEDGKELHCVTCKLENMAGMTCNYNQVILSNNFTKFSHFCGGPDVPDSFLRSLKMPYDINVISNVNTELRKKLEDVAIPSKKFFEVPLEDKRFSARVALSLPSDFNQDKKYPLFVSIYGGPGSQRVKQSFGITWDTSLVSQYDIIQADIDVRGTGKQSDEFMHVVYRQLGVVEIQDLIFVAKTLLNQMPYLDANKTAIWGWSYGGFLSATMMAKDTENVFKCGISVAPCTSWLLYDTLYTERYMGLPVPHDNFYGYNITDVTNDVENFRNKKYLLVHGNADDNVHYQQSMFLSKALELKDILFRQQSYPDENHSLGGVRPHLYHTLQDFLLNDCFGD